MGPGSSKPGPDGRTQLILSPLELIGRIAAEACLSGDPLAHPEYEYDQRLSL
jgi:hypothetical protein